MASDNGIISGGGKVVLPLLALGGIALWINYYYKKRPTVDDTKKDYLSQLPDEVLSSILANLTVRDAVRTSILSTRWRYLFASMPTLKFKCLYMFGVHTFSHSRCPYYQEKFMKGLIQCLQLYSGRRVANIELDCCFTRVFPSEFSHCLRSISRLGVERLQLDLNCLADYTFRDSKKLLQFSLETLSQASSLKHLFLSNCILLSSPKVHFNSLIVLALRGVVLASGHLEGIMTSCSNLKELTLVESKLPYKLRLTGTVTIVDLFGCEGVEEIDLHAAYLHTIKCKIYNNVRIIYSFVPMLENVIVFPCGGTSNSYMFGDCTRDLPDQVKSLTVKFYPHKVNCFPPEIEMFRSLRKLSLILLSNHESFEIVKLSPLLGVCPLLQCLNFMVRRDVIIKGGRGRRRPPLSPTCHTELKEVTFGGFDGSESEIEFVLYILRSAIVLERMFLTSRYKSYFGVAWRTYLNDDSLDVRKCNSIQQKLHGQAISRKAVVTIQ